VRYSTKHAHCSASCYTSLILLGLFTGFNRIGMCRRFVICYSKDGRPMGETAILYAAYREGKTLF